MSPCTAPSSTPGVPDSGGAPFSSCSCLKVVHRAFRHHFLAVNQEQENIGSASSELECRPAHVPDHIPEKHSAFTPFQIQPWIPPPWTITRFKSTGAACNKLMASIRFDFPEPFGPISTFRGPVRGSRP